MTNIERTLIEILTVVALVLGFAFYEQHKGAQKCVAADAVAVSKEEAKAAIKTAVDAQVIQQEAQTYHAAIADPTPIDVHVSLCHYAPVNVPRAAAPGPVPHAAPTSGSTDQGPPKDLGPPLVKVGRNADAQVKGLQDYIRNVCLVKP